MKNLVNSNKWMFIIIPLLIMVGLLGFILNRNQKPTTTEPNLILVEASFIADFTDPRQLAGVVDNIFVGHVVAEKGTINANKDTMPETQFVVEVTENIKGSLTGNIIVNQEGGLRTKDNAMVLYKNDSLLKIGESYLFATKTGNSNWHTLVPGFGDVLVKDNAHKEQLISNFSAATENQIPYHTTSQQ